MLRHINIPVLTVRQVFYNRHLTEEEKNYCPASSHIAYYVEVLQKAIWPCSHIGIVILLTYFKSIN